MHLQESGEMYLETIYVLSKNGVVRSLDVAEYMAFQSRASAAPWGFSNRAAIFSWTRTGI